MRLYSIWYKRPEFFRDGIMGLDWCFVNNKMPDPYALGKTHVKLMGLAAKDLNEVFRNMQGEVWSPHGEGKALLLKKGLVHTSMSVGDIAASDDALANVFFVDTHGWKELKEFCAKKKHGKVETGG
jgi:hypothetical protein